MRTVATALSAFATIVVSLVISLVISPVASADSGRTYRERPKLETRKMEKVKLTGRHTMYLPTDQSRPGTYAPSRGGHQILIGKRGPGGQRVYAKAELQGSRIYKSRRSIQRTLGIRISAYEEKSVVAYLPSKDPNDGRKRYYTVIGPKSGNGPLLIERRPSQLLGGKPVEFSVLDL